MTLSKQLDVFAHAVAGTGGGTLAMLLLYPLENIRIRLQVQKQVKGMKQTLGGIGAFKRIMEEEGVKGLYKGLEPALVGVAASSAVYFFWYNLFKQVLLKGKTLDPFSNTLVASLAAVINVFATCPLWTVSIQMTLNKDEEKGMISTLRDIYQKKGVEGLYAGLYSSLILICNPVIQFVVYDQLKHLMQKMGKRALGSLELFLLGAFAKTLATISTYPVQVVKSRMQTKGNSKSIAQIVRSIWKEEGVSSFYAGMSSKIVQSVLNSAFMFMSYEKLLALAYLLFALLTRRRKVPASS